jgi:prepilin-type N-terminal cleavage/methylation domain-containing protein
MNGRAIGKRGFSLLEIIVSLVILSALAAGIFATISFAKRVSIQAQQKAIAVSMIESRLNDLRSKVAAKVTLNSGDSVNDPLGMNDLGIISSGDCAQAEGGKPLPYCEEIDEFNHRMRGLVMAKVSGTTFQEVLVVAKWIDFTIPGRIRTESAVTAIETS